MLTAHKNPAEVNGLAWALDGSMIAIADSNGALSLFDGAIQEQVEVKPALSLHGHSSRVECVAFRPGG